MENNMNTKELLVQFKEKFAKELEDIDFSTVSSDYDVLEIVPEYVTLTNMCDNDTALKDKIEKAEKAVLRSKRLIKIVNEDNLGFYLKKGEPYDSEGNLIEDMFEDYLDNEDLFCEYVGDDTYDLMKKALLSKIRNMDRDEY
jgi:hypothetical protein